LILHFEKIGQQKYVPRKLFSLYYLHYKGRHYFYIKAVHISYGQRWSNVAALPLNARVN